MNPMSRFACIDIGSNSIRYMTEDDDRKLTVTTRLGSGLAETGKLAEATMRRSIRVIAAMADNAYGRENEMMKKLIAWLLASLLLLTAAAFGEADSFIGAWYLDTV
ncbi:MAG: hypothetical protein J5544_00680, partial [Clostridia bacterium]|nr:hypothetical protein [Clostridia bacterium]